MRARIKHRLSRIKKAVTGVDDIVEPLSLYKVEHYRLDNDLAGLVELITNRLKSRNSKFTLHIDSTGSWIELSDGAFIEVNSKFNSVSTVLLRQDEYEDTEIDLFKANVSSGDVVFDVGGNVGLYSIAAARIAKSVNVFTFEPVPDTLKELRSNVVKNKVENQVKIIPKALSSKAGTMYITTEYHSSNYITNANSEQQKTMIRVTTIDNFAKQEKIKRIDMIKMDIEGHELEALKGAQRSIERFRPKILIEIYENKTEFNDRQMANASEIFTFLAQFGYEYVIVGDNGKVISNPNKARKFSKSYHNYLFYCDKNKLKLV